MTLSRRSFFIVLFLILVVPWFIPKVIWIATSAKTTGHMEFIGHDNLGSTLGMTTYPVIKFDVGGLTFHFNGNMNVPLKKGDSVEIRFQKKHPSDARINSFGTLWGDTIAYGAGPFLFYLVLLLSPSIFPWKSRIRIGWPSQIELVGNDVEKK
jgi:hypothetical protein